MAEDLDKFELASHLDDGCGAVFIDTAAFIRERYKWKEERLAHLSQLKEKGLRVLTTDVVIAETKKHIAEDTAKAVRELRRALRGAEELLSAELRQKIIECCDEERQVKDAYARFDRFLESNGFEVVPVGDYVRPQEVFDLYFEGEAPFSSTGAKKAEFPDAFTLLAIQSWADKQETSAWVVSGDGDHRSFCEDSKSLIHLESLRELLAIQNLRSELGIAARRLVIEALQDDSSEVYGEVWAAIERTFDENFWFSTRIESAFNYEPLGEWAELKSMAPAEDKTGDAFVIAEDVTAKKTLVEAVMSLEIEVTGDFEFFVRDSVDGDNVPLGSASRSKDVSVDVPILIHLAGDFVDSEIQVERVEVITGFEHVDLGRLGPFDADEDE